LRAGVVLLTIGVAIAGCVDDDLSVKTDIHQELLKAVNDLRSTGCQCGQDWIPAVQPVTWNDTLEQVAYDHAYDMYTNNYFSHLSRDGTPPITRALQAGYRGIYVGENMAKGYSNVHDVMQGWIASESHCKNLMDTIYLEVGGARVSGYWVLDFGRSE